MDEEGEQRRRKKKKLEGNDAVSAKMKTPREGGNGAQTEEVTEDEVEEFFAILKRIHVAVSYFKGADHGDGRRLLPENGSSLTPTIEREIAGIVNSVGRSERREGAEDDLGFDLNAEPDPE